jgi:ribosomal protein L37AE/L43A
MKNIEQNMCNNCEKKEQLKRANNSISWCDEHALSILRGCIQVEVFGICMLF